VLDQKHSPVAIHRKWVDDPGLLDNARELFEYAPGDNRANGYLWMDGGQEWAPAFAERGAQLIGDLEKTTGTRFTIALFQAYMDGSGCDWHADLGYDVQAIVSLGVTRRFGIRRAEDVDQPRYYKVSHGDLLVMPSGFQDDWQHCVPEQPNASGERVALVFRSVAGS
jgi:alkylated DNA repair dioxygenase AlkB